MMGVYYGTVQSTVVHTNQTSPLSKNPRLEPRFPDEVGSKSGKQRMIV
jgi:hypothetical protein